LADIVDAKPSPAGHQLIDLEHLNRAIGLLRYLESHMHRVYGSIRSPEQRGVDTWAKHIARGDLGQEFGTGDIRRKCWEPLSDGGVIAQAIAGLEDMNWVRGVGASKLTHT